MQMKSLLGRADHAGAAALQKQMKEEVASAIDNAAVAQAAQKTADRRINQLGSHIWAAIAQK